MTEVTYSRLDKVLRALRFSCRVVENAPKARVYEHAATGALIVFPVLPDEQTVFPHHLAAVRGTLDKFGIAAPLEFDARLQKAS
jgi:hypothetical protein